VTGTEKKPLGRPRKYTGKRPTWTIRLQSIVGDRIKAIAKITGRSLSEVCEQQITESFLLRAEVDELKVRIEEQSNSTQAFEMRMMHLLGKVNDGYARFNNAQKKIEELTELLSKRDDQHKGITPEIEAIIDLAVQRARAK
jgi:hypothetical protein